MKNNNLKDANEEHLERELIDKVNENYIKHGYLWCEKHESSRCGCVEKEILNKSDLSDDYRDREDQMAQDRMYSEESYNLGNTDI